MAINQDFAKDKSKLIVKKYKLSNLGDALNKLMQLKRITDGGMGTKPPNTEGFRGLGAKPPAAGRLFFDF